jgi:hypothetical protein
MLYNYCSLSNIADPLNQQYQQLLACIIKGSPVKIFGNVANKSGHTAAFSNLLCRKLLQAE